LRIGPNHLQEDFVDKDQRAKTKVTEEQKRKVKPATERDAETVELGAEELEERIAPMTMY
jgi:adenine-specific DNA methylase